MRASLTAAFICLLVLASEPRTDGFGIFRKSGLEQIFLDARLGRIHPANSMLTHEIVAKTVLGISPDETPRWG